MTWYECAYGAFAYLRPAYVLHLIGINDANQMCVLLINALSFFFLFEIVESSSSVNQACRFISANV